MNFYTGKEYLYIDIANHFGLDKITFEKRIEWVTCNQDRLEGMAHLAEEKPLYVKAVMTLRKAEQGIPVGHMCALDACASGTQIMSALTGCIAGATATGLVDPDRRADAYKDLTTEMNESLVHGEKTEVARKSAKDAFMKFLYGSEAEPKNIFGEHTPAYRAFFPAVEKIAPGAYALRNLLVDSWQAYQEEHVVEYPDDFTMVLRSFTEESKVFEVDELDHATFSHIYKEYQGVKHSVSLAANVIHGIDGMVVREMNRRCNYESNLDRITIVYIGLSEYCKGEEATDFTQFLSLNAIDDINMSQLDNYDMNMLCRLRDLCEVVLDFKSGPLVANHDAFKGLAGHMNKVRYWYKEILAEIADSNVLQDILNQLLGSNAPTVTKLSDNLGELIRKSNYALS